MTATKAPPPCGHFRHWNDGVVDDGTGDWETCDECGRLVCFDTDCPNGWGWDEDSNVLCFRHLDEDPDAPDDGKVLIAGVLYDRETGMEADPQ